MAAGEALFERVVQATGELSLFSERPRVAVDPLLASGGAEGVGVRHEGWLKVCVVHVLLLGAAQMSASGTRARRPWRERWRAGAAASPA